MKRIVLLLALFALGLSAASFAVAKPPPGNGKDKNTTTSTTALDPETCHPKVSLVLKGDFVSGGGDSFTMAVKSANAHARQYAGKALTLKVDGKTSFKRNGPATLAELQGRGPVERPGPLLQGEEERDSESERERAGSPCQARDGPSGEVLRRRRRRIGNAYALRGSSREAALPTPEGYTLGRRPLRMRRIIIFIGALLLVGALAAPALAKGGPPPGNAGAGKADPGHGQPDPGQGQPDPGHGKADPDHGKDGEQSKKVIEAAKAQLRKVDADAKAAAKRAAEKATAACKAAAEAVKANRSSREAANAACARAKAAAKAELKRIRAKAKADRERIKQDLKTALELIKQGRGK
jgi:hypothetical protein